MAIDHPPCFFLPTWRCCPFAPCRSCSWRVLPESERPPKSQPKGLGGRRMEVRTPLVVVSDAKDGAASLRSRGRKVTPGQSFTPGLCGLQQ